MKKFDDAFRAQLRELLIWRAMYVAFGLSRCR
jgi:hypothetical protein